MSEIQIYAIVGVCVFMLLDIITGFAGAMMSKCVSSQAMREGFFHKFAIIVLLVIAIMLDYSQSWLNIGIDIPVLEASCTYLIIMELASVLENIGKMNPELLSNPLFILLESATNQEDEITGKHVEK